MNSKERLAAVSKGEKPDRIPFLPTIFEHCASVIGRSPSEAALDMDLLVEAQVKAYEVYGHDSVTVGVDVYNIEAEALGCEIKFHDDNSIPGVITHPFSNGIILDDIVFSTGKGRIGRILSAAERIKDRLSSEVGVGLGISGPFSISAELLGYEDIIMRCIDEDEELHRLLEAVLEFQKSYCDEIIKRGLGIAIFESWAAPPLVTPDVYRSYVMPYEKELISYIKSRNVAACPLIIGGDTSSIADNILETGTTLLVADYKVDVRSYIDKASARNIIVRGNIDPKLVQKGSKEDIIRQMEHTLDRMGGYPKFVLGTGVIPYDTPMENLLMMKKYLEEYAVK